MQGHTFLLHVAVSSQLPHGVILGQDLPILCNLLSQVQSCYVVTQSQSSTIDFSELPFADVILMLRWSVRKYINLKRKGVRINLRVVW